MVVDHVNITVLRRKSLTYLLISSWRILPVIIPVANNSPTLSKSFSIYLQAGKRKDFFRRGIFIPSS